MNKWWSFFTILIVFACTQKESIQLEHKPFITPKGKTKLIDNNYSNLTTLEINWQDLRQIETTLNLANKNCGLRIGAIAKRDSTSHTFVYSGNQPMDSIFFFEADSCILYFNPSFDLGCKLKQDSILFH